MNCESFADLLQKALVPDQNIRIQAEKKLEQLKTQPGICVVILQFLQKNATNQANMNMMLASSIFFKNLVCDIWSDVSITTIISLYNRCVSNIFFFIEIVNEISYFVR